MPVVISVWQEEDYKVYLKTSGVSWQIGEHFSLEIENIRDENWNNFLPSPKQITLVQR